MCSWNFNYSILIVYLKNEAILELLTERQQLSGERYGLQQSFALNIHQHGPPTAEFIDECTCLKNDFFF